MNKLAFVVPIHVCLPLEREVFGVRGGITPFSVLCFSKKFERIGTKGHGNVFASAKGKQQK